MLSTKPLPCRPCLVPNSPSFSIWTLRLLLQKNFLSLNPLLSSVLLTCDKTLDLGRPHWFLFWSVHRRPKCPGQQHMARMLTSVISSGHLHAHRLAHSLTWMSHLKQWPWNLAFQLPTVCWWFGQCWARKLFLPGSVLADLSSCSFMCFWATCDPLGFLPHSPSFAGKLTQFGSYMVKFGCKKEKELNSGDLLDIG